MCFFQWELQQEQSRSQPQDIWGKDCFPLGAGRSSSKGKENWKSECTSRQSNFCSTLYVCYNLFNCVASHNVRHHVPIHMDMHLTSRPAAPSCYSIKHPKPAFEVFCPCVHDITWSAWSDADSPASPFSLSDKAVPWTYGSQRAETQTAALGFESASKK